MLVALAALPILALCFSHSDIELFKLRNAVAADLGDGASFYSWLGVKKNAKVADIVKAYRKLSRRLHPDRNPGQEATERFARLNRVYKILRSPVREQYDSYLRSGFPLYDEATEEWHYRRFRPSLLLALVLVALLFTGVEFVVRKVSAHRQREHLSAIVTDAQTVAKANSSTPGIIVQRTDVRVGKNTLTVHPSGDVFFKGTRVSADGVEEPTWKSTFAGKLLTAVTDNSAGKAAETVPVMETVSVETAPPAEPETAADVSASKSETVEPLKKGAARRRPAAARGKAKVF